MISLMAFVLFDIRMHFIWPFFHTTSWTGNVSFQGDVFPFGIIEWLKVKVDFREMHSAMVTVGL